jgi:hypothetical protein
MGIALKLEFVQLKKCKGVTQERMTDEKGIKERIDKEER